MKKYKVKFWKKRDAPKSSPLQQQQSQAGLVKLATDIVPISSRRQIIYDDESYFPLANTTKPGFFASDPNSVDENIRFSKRAKFGEKVCMWIAISKKGHSEPYFKPAKNAINAEIYRTECVKARLYPFIKKFYPNGRYIFWPDKATCHYARSTLETIEELGINILPADDNPANVPQLRPIERFWALLKRKVYSDGWEAKTREQLIRRIRLKLREFDEAALVGVIEHDKEKILTASIHGPLSVINQNFSQIS